MDGELGETAAVTGYQEKPEIPYGGYWLDIGRHEDYEKAILEYDELKQHLFRE
jgi:NDP-sugar pyrophosphorylase family protein